jgi:hypothetical protein
MKMEPISEHEKQKIMVQTWYQMAAYTRQFICALYYVIDKERGALAGSGSFLYLNGESYILTAGHVAKESKTFQGLAHSTSYGERPTYISNPYKCLEHPLDLALVKIDPTFFASGEKTYLRAAQLASTSDGVDSDLLFLHGFPGEKSKPVYLLRGVFSETLPYGGFTGSCTKYCWFDPKLHIALHYASKGMIDASGKEAKWIDPHGLSGSALWKTNRAGTPARTWSPEMARIVGVVFAHDDKAESLIATRIEVVRDFLLFSIRQECAYLNWINRGRPLWDDLLDWVHAENRIGGL